MFHDRRYGTAFGWICLFLTTNLWNQCFVKVKEKHIITAVVGIEDDQVKFDCGDKFTTEILFAGRSYGLA